MSVGVGGKQGHTLAKTTLEFGDHAVISGSDVLVIALHIALDEIGPAGIDVADAGERLIDGHYSRQFFCPAPVPPQLETEKAFYR